MKQPSPEVSIERLTNVGRSLASQLLGDVDEIPKPPAEFKQIRTDPQPAKPTKPAPPSPPAPRSPDVRQDKKQSPPSPLSRDQSSDAYDAQPKAAALSSSVAIEVSKPESKAVVPATDLGKVQPPNGGQGSVVRAFSDLPWSEESDEEERASWKPSIDLRKAFSKRNQAKTLEDDEEEDAKPSRRVKTSSKFDLPAVAIAAVVIALIFRVFVFATYRIPSESMYPTLQVSDRVVVNKLSYKLGGIGRGDLIVFDRPPTAPAAAGEPQKLIKRVVGMPGETIEARGGEVYINGELLNESEYLDPGIVTNNLTDKIEIPEGELFVMGDNRERSQDSRFIGTVDEDLVIGRAMVIIWPIGRATGL